ncbi:carbonyl reductase [NADPH] 1-like [Haliotis rufescens]|uniref:carbonyl reductase [NADPH] 1-like n=1 Tax=Haliotis rufescens TaxID=6454 RepID=UPI00201F5132|nr:carbonyl reductase [NADPH] 1-like [Haliotis rufescens]
MSGSWRVAVVTGGNRGIGRSLVRNLCQTFDGTVYLTARNEERGKKAVQDLKTQGLNPRFHQLDIDSRDSICDFAKHLKETHDGVDVVIANGAVSYEKNSPIPLEEQSEANIRINNIGNANLYQALEPLLRQDGRYVIVSSRFGQLTNISEKLRPKFQTDNMSIDQLNCVLSEYVTSTKDGSYKDKGWPDWPNVMSQVGRVALTRIIVQSLKDNPRRLLVNASCPGWTVTDAARSYLDVRGMFGDVKAKNPDEAAVDLVWLATLPAGTTSPHGELVQYRKIVSYEG